MTDPARPRECGRWWLPGMNKAAGETPTGRAACALHHAIVADGIAYALVARWRVDVARRQGSVDTKLIARRNWSPPYAGGTHTCLPLPDRGLLVVADEAVRDIDVEGVKHTWIFDIRDAQIPSASPRCRSRPIRTTSRRAAISARTISGKIGPTPMLFFFFLVYSVNQEQSIL